jgi:hypothetical protein
MTTTDGDGITANSQLGILLRAYQVTEILKGNSTTDVVEISLPSSEWVARPHINAS